MHQPGQTEPRIAGRVHAMDKSGRPAMSHAAERAGQRREQMHNVLLVGMVVILRPG